MNKKTLAFGAVVLVGVALALAWFARYSGQPTVTPTPSASASPSGAYNNKYLSVKVPPDWKLTEKDWSVNITKDNWILYINPVATQASGVQGGRFDEWAAGAPGVELVMGRLEKPRDATQCAAIAIKYSVARIQEHFVDRRDFYTPSQDAVAACNLPHSGPPAWYFAIIGKQLGFNDVSTVTSQNLIPAPNNFPVRQFAITMTYKAATVTDLPKRGSTELVAALQAMDSIVSSIVFH